MAYTMKFECTYAMEFECKTHVGPKPDFSARTVPGGDEGVGLAGAEGGHFLIIIKPALLLLKY